MPRSSFSIILCPFSQLLISLVHLHIDTPILSVHSIPPYPNIIPPSPPSLHLHHQTKPTKPNTHPKTPHLAPTTLHSPSSPYLPTNQPTNQPTHPTSPPPSPLITNQPTHQPPNQPTHPQNPQTQIHTLTLLPRSKRTLIH